MPKSQTQTTREELIKLQFMEGTYSDRLNALEEYALTLAKKIDGRPTLSTYTVLTGDTYQVEATSEEEALKLFFEWFNGDKDEFRNTVIEEGEALTIIYDHD